MLQLRGIERARLLEKLHRAGHEESEPHSAAQESASSRELAPLPADAEKFWHVEALELSMTLNAADIQAAVIKRLGHFPFWRSEQPFLNVMEEIYRQAAIHGLRIYVGDSGEEKVK